MTFYDKNNQEIKIGDQLGIGTAGYTCTVFDFIFDDVDTGEWLMLAHYDQFPGQTIRVTQDIVSIDYFIL